MLGWPFSKIVIVFADGYLGHAYIGPFVIVLPPLKYVLPPFWPNSSYVRLHCATVTPVFVVVTSLARRGNPKPSCPSGESTAVDRTSSPGPPCCSFQKGSYSAR